MVCISKRGKVYQYKFEIAKVDGKRKFVNKSGYKTKNQAYAAGQRAYNEYINGELKSESYMSYSDYLDYWLMNYCEINLKYRTIEEYSTIVNKYLKPELGHYRLNSIMSFQLNKFLAKISMQYNYSHGYLKIFLKVIKSSFRVACDIFGFINYNPTITLRLPQNESLKKTL